MEGLGGALVWFRNDLRVTANPALQEAIRYVTTSKQTYPQQGATLSGLVILSAYEYRHLACWGLAKTDYYLRTVEALSSKLATLNIPLKVQIIKHDAYHSAESYYQALGQVLVQMAHQHRAGALFLNGEYEHMANERDRAVFAALDRAGIAHHLTHDQCVVPVGRLLTKSGTPFRIFTQFKKAWMAYLDQHRLDPPETAHRQECPLSVSKEGKVIPSPIHVESPAIFMGFTSEGDYADLDLESVRREFPPGEDAAQQTLRSFLAHHVKEYHNKRNLAEEGGSSRLSAPLAVGSICLRQCLMAARQVDGIKGEGLQAWINELCWREFYRHVLHHFPQVAKGHAFQAAHDRLPWRGWPGGGEVGEEVEEEFARWCEGRTGVPIVDAAMRQLRREAWLPNRMRMVVAMYLAKELLIHWRRGEHFFMRHLIDYDYASNNGGWQWSASTGTDAQPYFRIFNPFLQSERFDPDGHYIRKYVSELALLSPPAIHNPAKHLSNAEQQQLNYPKEIIDHGIARARVLAFFAKPKAEGPKEAKRQDKSNDTSEANGNKNKKGKINK